METQNTSSRTYSVIIGVILGIIAIVHLLRIIFGVEIMIGGVTIPQWPSVVAVIIAGFLSWKSLCR